MSKKDGEPKPEKTAETRRIKLLGVFILVCVLIFAYRLYRMQVFNYSYYEDLAEGQYVAAPDQEFNRGEIYFVDKQGNQLSAATVRRGFKLAMTPSVITNAPELKRVLSQFSSFNQDRFERAVVKTDDPYEEIAYQILPDEASLIASENLEGVHLYPQQWRDYPRGSMAAQTIGFLGHTTEGQSGLYGLERQFNQELEYIDDSTEVNFFASVYTRLGSLVDSAVDPGAGNIVTTIEPTVQSTLEEQLQLLMDTHRTEQVGGIIIDPSTGRINALASYPSFDPRTYSQVDSISVYQNPLVEYVYEMGSIIKPLVVAAGIDSGAIDASTQYYDEGLIEVGDQVIYNYDKIGRGYVTVSQVLAQSLNTGMVFIGQDTGKKTLRSYLEQLGLGSKTGIDLPNESAGLVGNLKSMRDVEYANIAFGQGLAITPMAVTRALSALANGGKLITPHVVDSIQYRTHTQEISANHQANDVVVFSPETTEAVSRILTTVIDNQISKGDRKLPNHSVAAKTGTAQIPNPEGGYYTDRNLHSFFGYVPAYDPKYLVFLYAVHPKDVRYAAESLTTPFMTMIDFLVNYYNIPPDR